LVFENKETRGIIAKTSLNDDRKRVLFVQVNLENLNKFMTQRKRKRFIAGATCPKCQKQDTLMLFFENNVEKLECVSCGYHQSQAKNDVKVAAKGNSDVIGVFKPE